MIDTQTNAGTTATEAELKTKSAAWSSTLASTASELKTISSTTEDEFLDIGGRLQEFYQRATGISGLASEMVGQAAGSEVGSAVEGLREILDEMGQYVGDAQQETALSSETLNEVIKLLETVSAPLAGFKKINKVLRMLGISTKIESARLGQSAAGFDTLATDVGQLSVQVNEKAGIVLGRKIELDGAIRQTLNGVLNSGAQQHDQVLAILEKTRGSLTALTDINTRCSSAAAHISAAFEEVSRNIGEVVMSMQSHDIVRQQIEHVEESLRELTSRSGDRVAGADEIASICELQSAQLQHASGELEGAVQAIIVNLKEIARKQSGLSRETSGMAGTADQAGVSFFSEMEKDIAVVTVALTDSSQANRRLCLAMGGVAETVVEIANLVGDIETLGEEIKLIALNAQIKSAYTGEEGAALGVLAEAIQRLSVDAIDHTSAVSGALQGIREVTQRLNSGVSQETSALELKVRAMVETLSTLLAGLRQVNGTLRSSLGRMDDQVQLLCHDIETVTARITVHRKVAQVLGGAVESLKGVIAEARRFAPASAHGGHFEDLASRYTMHSERKIHSSILGRGTPAVAAPPSFQPDQDLGGNVELF